MKDAPISLSAYSPADRCRLILSVSLSDDVDAALEQALGGGDVASVIISTNGLSDNSFQQQCENLVSLVQAADVAAIVACDDLDIVEQVGADGMLIKYSPDALKTAIARFSPHKIVGCGGIKNRHRALEAGELNPSFMFFGALDRDIRAEPHRKNLALADWWAQLVEIPCAVMGGNSIESAIDVALSGAEFVILDKAVFSHQHGAAQAVEKVNELLDEFGPRFDEA